MTDNSPSPISRGFHIALGGVAAVSGWCLVESAAVGTAIVLSSIAYVTWTARRIAGLVFASCAGAIELWSRIDPSGLSNRDAAVAGIWVALYLIVVYVASAIERATRPASP